MNEDKIPTAEEYFKTEFEIWEKEYPELKTACKRKLIEFTKLHLKAQEKAHLEKVRLTSFATEFLQEGAYEAIDYQSIEDAYPLSNVK